METNIKDGFQWLLGIWKTSDGRSVYKEWLPKDENTIDGFRYVLEYGQKDSQEKYRLRRRGGDIYFLIIGSKAACSVELKMNFLSTGEKPLILGDPPMGFEPMTGRLRIITLRVQT
jgi:hypothetical protein